MTTPKMAAMTPNSLGNAFGFSPALLGHSPAAASQFLLAKHGRSPLPGSGGPIPNYNSPSMLSALGIGSTVPPGVAALPPDESKRRELSEVLRLLASRPGRISAEAVERLAKGMGLECYKETAPTGVVTLSLAAKIFLIDIDFRGDNAERVTLNFEKTPDPTQELAARAAEIFHRNLQLKTETPSLLTPSLAPFADNLNRLTSIDRLSTTSMNCFAAVTGIYQSLRRIYEYEKTHMEGGAVAAMCAGSGRPRMHTRGKVGLSVDYWKPRRSIPRAEKAASEDDEKEGTKPWRVIIEVEETSADYGHMQAITPVRTTDHWVSEEVKKSREDLFGEIEEADTDWLDPPLEVLMDNPDDLSQPRPPAAHFLARLDPPVALPFNEEAEIYRALMLPPPPSPDLTTLEMLLFPTLAPTSFTADRQVSLPPAEGTAGDIDDNDDEPLQHRYRLNAALKPVFARHVSELPFSHPKDLLGYFGILRQYALVATLLESCFATSTSTSSSSPPVATDTVGPPELDDDDGLDAFMSDDQPAAATGPLPIDVSVLPEVGFGIGVVFPRKDALVNVVAQVGRNAELRAECTVDGGAGGKPRAKLVERALGICEDVGLVVELMRRTE